MQFRKKEKNIKRLTQIIKDYKIISVVGNTKNAGKTTVINSILEDLDFSDIAITSIGLDGEEIDQITYMKKPRIYALKGYIIATAKNTLSEFEAKFEVISETDILTPIGNIVIIRVLKAGNVLIAGPSIVIDMEKIIKMINKYSPKHVFIDGAFFRHSLARIADANILVVGANYSNNINKVVSNAIDIIKKFNLKKVPSQLGVLEWKDNVCLINEQNNIKDLGFTTVIGNTAKIFDEENKKYQFLYLPQALTNELLLKMVKERAYYSFDIILNSPVNIQLNAYNLSNLFKLKSQIYVIHPINLVAVCYNPFSPQGYSFNELMFRDKLEEELKIEVFNVKKEVQNE